MNTPPEIPKGQATYSADETTRELILSLPPVIRGMMYKQVRQQAAEGDEVAQSWLEQYGDLDDEDEAN